MASAGMKIPPLPALPEFVLYVATGDETSPGKVYQVDEHGRVLGWVNTPYQPTGMALHRTHGLTLAMPRDGGRLMHIDDTGKLTTIVEKDPNMVHPIDVAMSGDSDTVVVADNIGDVLLATNTGGIKPKVYKRFEGQKWVSPSMSVAVCNDKSVLLGTDGDQGIFRYSGDAESASKGPILPGKGGVAADPKSLLWAATQEPNQVYVFEGQELVKKLRLPPNKSIYGNGMLSFAPTGNLVVAVRDSDSTNSGVWFLEYRVKGSEDEKNARADGTPAPAKPKAANPIDYMKAWSAQEPQIRSLFPWEKEKMNDFVVGPRMFWDRKSPNTYKSVY
jgi:hypothetical protein